MGWPVRQAARAALRVWRDAFFGLPKFRPKRRRIRERVPPVRRASSGSATSELTPLAAFTPTRRSFFPGRWAERSWVTPSCGCVLDVPSGKVHALPPCPVRRVMLSSGTTVMGSRETCVDVIFCMVALPRVPARILKFRFRTLAQRCTNGMPSQTASGGCRVASLVWQGGQGGS
jgi:hypothetical protein